MKLAIITAHAGADTLFECCSSWGWKGTVMALWDGDENGIVLAADPQIHIMKGQAGMLPAYQKGLEKTKTYHYDKPPAEFLAYLHDDCRINDPQWPEKVLAEFRDPAVGLVGFGGAKDHGARDIYKIPYDYRQLGRSRFISNMEDAEVHGERFTGSTEVAVLDGFALIVRRELLEKAGGWPIGTPVGYVAYDYWLSCIAHRLGYKIRLVGVACKHYGGATFVKLGVGKTEEAQKQYWDAHKYIYDEFKDTLPWRCE